MGIPRGLLVRNTDSGSPLRRRDFTFTIFDDAGRAGTNAAYDSVGDVLLGVPEPDATNTSHVFVVDRVFLAASQKGGTGATDYVEADVFAGPAGTTMLTTKPKLFNAGTFPLIAKTGGTNITDQLTNPVLKAASSCEVPAGTGLYADINVVNDTTTVFGAITLIVSGYYKDEF